MATKLHLRRKKRPLLADPDVVLTLGQSGKQIPFLYDNSNLHFSSIIFIKELLIHLFFPLTVYWANPCHQFFPRKITVSSDNIFVSNYFILNNVRCCY